MSATCDSSIPTAGTATAVIAIDGPAASGKSTVGYAVAHALDYLFFDTGVLYRAVTWAALDHGLNPHDGDAVAALAEAIRIDVAPPDAGIDDGRQCTVLVDGRDVTWALRTPDVDQHVSIVSAHAGVRAALAAQQRRIGLRYGSGQAEKAGVVMVGRDIGTVVLPEAPLKIFMVATPAERARRRHLELVARGKEIDYDDVLRDIVNRDRQDSQRDVSPLRPAEDAVVIDTSALSPEAVTDQIVTLSRQAAGGAV